jgi:hypothetical protein
MSDNLDLSKIKPENDSNKAVKTEPFTAPSPHAQSSTTSTKPTTPSSSPAPARRAFVPNLSVDRSKKDA